MRSSRILVAMLSGCCVSGVFGQSPPATESEAPRATDTPGLEVFPSHPTRAVVIRACAPCHVPELVVAQRRTADEWDRIILAMVDRGAVATDEEQLQILEYLLHFFGPAREGASE